MMQVTNVKSNTLAINSATERLNQFYGERQASNTRRTYDTAIKRYEAWAIAQNLPPLPATIESVGLYLVSLFDAGLSLSTIKTHRAALADWHTQRDLENPCNHHAIKGVLQSIVRKRHKAKEQPKQAKAASADDVSVIIERLTDTPQDLRAKAMLTLARSGLARRSELVAIDIADLEMVTGTFTLWRQKTGTSQECAMTPAAKRAVGDWVNWLEAQGQGAGPLFRRFDRWGSVRGRLAANVVNRVFKAAYATAGLDSRGISGHSARVGSAVDLAIDGADALAIGQAGGWSSPVMPARYVKKIEATRGAVAMRLAV